MNKMIMGTATTAAFSPGVCSGTKSIAATPKRPTIPENTHTLRASLNEREKIANTLTIKVLTPCEASLVVNIMILVSLRPTERFQKRKKHRYEFIKQAYIGRRKSHKKGLRATAFWGRPNRLGLTPKPLHEQSGGFVLSPKKLQLEPRSLLTEGEPIRYGSRSCEPPTCLGDVDLERGRALSQYPSGSSPSFSKIQLLYTDKTRVERKSFTRQSLNLHETTLMWVHFHHPKGAGRNGSAKPECS